jgi:hypothetical protein
MNIGKARRREIDRLLTIPCNLHGDDCLSIECRIIEHAPRPAAIINLRHDALIRQALGDSDPDLPHYIFEAGQLALDDGDAELYLLAMLHLEDLGYAWWNGIDWILDLPRKDFG